MSIQKAKKSWWIGENNRDFERVSLAFEIAGYLRPTTEYPNIAGVYVSTLCEQYRADLTETQVRAIVTYAINRSMESLRADYYSKEVHIEDMVDFYF